MRTLLTGECKPENIFRLMDSTGLLEVDFEAEVVKAVTCLLPDYFCGVFAGSFILEGDRKNADLALIHKSLSHWFVVEVELASHSLEHHVIPQVRCFRFGEPELSCVTSLCRGFAGITMDQAERLLAHVPRCVADQLALPWKRSTGGFACDCRTEAISGFRRAVWARSRLHAVLAQGGSFFAGRGVVLQCSPARRLVGLNGR